MTTLLFVPGLLFLFVVPVLLAMPGGLVMPLAILAVLVLAA